MLRNLELLKFLSDKDPNATCEYEVLRSICYGGSAEALEYLLGFCKGHKSDDEEVGCLFNPGFIVNRRVLNNLYNSAFNNKSTEDSIKIALILKKISPFRGYFNHSKINDTLSSGNDVILVQKLLVYGFNELDVARTAFMMGKINFVVYVVNQSHYRSKVRKSFGHIK